MDKEGPKLHIKESFKNNNNNNKINKLFKKKKKKLPGQHY